MKSHHLTVTICLAMLLGSLTGCTSKRHVYSDHSANQVWTAMLAVAESPEYDDWHVTMNEVWVDDEQARIEVYRELRRILHRPRQQQVNQRRTWRFQITLEDDDPPTARIVSRGMSVPAHAMKEVDRYLVDVRSMLNTGIATSSPRAPEEQTKRGPDDEVAQPEFVPEVDLDDLD